MYNSIQAPLRGVGGIVGKQNWGTAACGVFLSCVVTAIALPARTVTKSGGGAFAYGTILAQACGPFVEMNPASGKVGASVEIQGANLTGATTVKFGGTAATFAVTSKSLITATVPAGAKTGTVEVLTPSGPYSSKVSFHVLP
jgi:hypothetical protein